MPRLKTAAPPPPPGVKSTVGTKSPSPPRRRTASPVKVRSSSPGRSRGRARRPVPAPVPKLHAVTPTVRAASPARWNATPSPVDEEEEVVHTVAAKYRLPQFDPRDTAPEDRNPPPKCQYKNSFKAVSHLAFRGEPVVSGSLTIKGVNCMRYAQLVRQNPRASAEFEDAIREDLASLVGCGVKAQDILMNISAGKVSALSLIYDERGDDPDDRNYYLGPRVREATCDMNVELIMRARDVMAQQSIAATFYSALQDGSFSLRSTAAAYSRWVDPTLSRPPSLTVKPTQKEMKPTYSTGPIGSSCAAPTLLYRS